MDLSEFEARLRVLGLKLCIKRLKLYGSPSEFVKAHMRKPPDSVKSGAIIFKDVLFVRLLEAMPMRGSSFAMRPNRNRKFFIYSPFLYKMKQGYLFRRSGDTKWTIIFKD